MSASGQTGLSVIPACGGMRNIATRQQLVCRGEQIIFDGVVFEGIVSEGLSTMHTLGLPISPILSPSSFEIAEKETAQSNYVSRGILISGFVNPVIATAKCDKTLFLLDHIDIGSHTLAFAKPITANVSFDNDIYTCRSEELGIISASSKLDDCTRDFKDEVLFLYNEYGKEEDSKLTEGAKELKRKILEHIGK
jgi:hypothetical protein